MSSERVNNGRAVPDHYLLVLLRHGESLWNAEDRFTGWMDVPLTAQGEAAARRAGQALKAAHFDFDLAFTSVLPRAIRSLEIVLAAMDREHLPVMQAWQLNERHYGALQGLSKAGMARHLGARRVMHWRRSYTGRPPALTWDDHRHPRFDPRYAGLPPEHLPRTESLHDTAVRLLPLWQTAIAPAIQAGKRVLIVAHGNSLRALAACLEKTPEALVPDIKIPTGMPWVYTLDRNLQPLSRVELSTS